MCTANHFVRAQKNYFGGMQGLGHLKGDTIGVDAVGPAFAIKTKRGNDGNDSFLEEKFQSVVIDTFHSSRKELIHPPENAGGMSNDRVGIGSPQIDGGESLHDPVCKADTGVDCQFERRFIRYSGAVAIGRA